MAFKKVFPNLWLWAFALLTLCGCNEPKVTEDKDADRVRNFIEREVELYNNGQIHTHRELIANLRAFYTSHKPMSEAGRFQVYSMISRYYYQIREYDSCNAYADTMLSIATHKDYPYILDHIGALTSKGEVLYALNHFTQAYSYYFQAKQLAEQTGNICGTQGITYGMAMIAYRQKKYREAARYFRGLYESVLACNDPYSFQLQEDLDNIALCYEKLNMFDSALYYYNSTLACIRNHSKEYSSEVMTGKALGVVYGNMGGVLLKMGKTDSAIALLEKSYNLNIQPHYDNEDALLTHLKLARAYDQKGDVHSFKQALDNIRHELDTLPRSLEAEASWRELMYQYFEKTGNMPEAFHYYRGYASLRDSLWQMDKMQIQNDLDRELKDKEQLNQISLLQKQNQVNNLYLVVTVGFSLLALVIIALVYVYYNKSRKNVQRLKLLNDQISEQKEQLEETTAELRQSIQDKDRILHVVAHDLRNPVSVVMMLSNMILDETTDPEQRESLKMIVDASQSGLTLISELLEFSGDRRQSFAANKETVDVNELVKHSSDLLRFKAGEKKQDLKVTFSEHPLYVHVNKEKMNRVLGNIITNAIKFSAENSAIHINVSQNNEKVIVAIKDNGIGIPDKLLPLIFEPFTSAKRYGTSGERSFGLGLSICRQIVEANGGNIRVESLEGKGSTFFIELPVYKR